MRGRLGLIATSVVALLLVAGIASSAAATKTTITLDTRGPTFTTTGGALCPSGTGVVDVDHVGGNDVAGTFHVAWTLVCGNGSGSFTIKVNAATVVGSPTDQGGWSVVSGTGAYANLHGGGSLVGTYVNPGPGIIDLYTGVVTK